MTENNIMQIKVEKIGVGITGLKQVMEDMAQRSTKLNPH